MKWLKTFKMGWVKVELDSLKYELDRPEVREFLHAGRGAYAVRYSYNDHKEVFWFSDPDEAVMFKLKFVGN